MDSDLQLSPQDLPKLYNVRRNDSVVVGTRTPRVDPLGRVLLGAFFSRIVVPILFGVRVRDVDCALKVIPRQIVANNRLMSEGALINAELLFVAKREGFAVIECPVGHYPRRAGEQSGGSLRVVSRALWAMVSLRLALPQFGNSQPSGCPVMQRRGAFERVVYVCLHALLFAAVFYVFSTIQFSTSGLLDPDGYYHSKVAALLAESWGLPIEFPLVTQNRIEHDKVR
jgi:hypothetical protein